MNRFVRTGIVIVCAFAFVLALSGCFRGGVPNQVTIELPDGTVQTVPQGAGVPSLADSTWEFFENRGEGQTTAFLMITFGSEGNLTRFDGNTIAPQVFGDTIYFDGERHATNQQGVTYVAATYGAETNDATGFGFEGRLTAYAGPITAATAKASASGTFAPDDPDTMTGTFSIQSEVTLAQVPGGNVDDTFDFIAHRVLSGE